MEMLEKQKPIELKRLKSKDSKETNQESIPSHASKSQYPPQMIEDCPWDKQTTN